MRTSILLLIGIILLFISENGNQAIIASIFLVGGIISSKLSDINDSIASLKSKFDQ